MPCTVDSDEVFAIEYGKICFGSFDKVIIGDDITCFVESNVVLKEGVEVCFDQGKVKGIIARPRKQVTRV